MKPNSTVRGTGKPPSKLPRKPQTPGSSQVKQPVARPDKPTPRPLARAKEDAKAEPVEFGVAFVTGVNPTDKKRAMKFLKHLATAPKGETMNIARDDVGATVKVILALMDDADRLASLLMWHMDVAEEGVCTVELLLSDPVNRRHQQIARRWYDSVRTEGPPSDLCSPTN